jgi:hypothetical protein
MESKELPYRLFCPPCHSHHPSSPIFCTEALPLAPSLTQALVSSTASQPSALDLRKAEERRAIVQRAERMLLEQRDEVKRMNALIQHIKCEVARDGQVSTGVVLLGLLLGWRAAA